MGSFVNKNIEQAVSQNYFVTLQNSG